MDCEHKIEISSLIIKISYMKKVILILIGFLSLSYVCDAQSKVVYVVPETAKIYYNGAEVGNGSYTVKFGRHDEFVMLKFEAPGYITKSVKLFKNNPKKTVSYELFVDEAEMNSVGAGEGMDLANMYFTVTCKNGMSEVVVW